MPGDDRSRVLRERLPRVRAMVARCRSVWPPVVAVAWLLVTRAEAAPLRTTNPSTGLFAGRIIAPRFLLTEASGHGVAFQEQGVSLDLTTRPSPRTTAGVVIPYLMRELRTGGRTYRQEGLGDVGLFGKYRFHRKLSTWGDAQAAFLLAVRTPSGSTGRVGPGLAETLSRSLQTGTGTWGLTADLSYQRARKRFILGGNAAYTANIEARGFRPGSEVRLNLDTEYLLLPLRYRAPGKEMFVLLEWLFVHREPSRLLGRELPSTGGTQFFLAPGVQYAASERLLLEASVALPVYQDLRGRAPRADFNVLVGLRYVY